MKILLINKFHYNKGGSETYHFALDELLKTHGHEVIHFAMRDEKNLESPTSDYFTSNIDFDSASGIFGKLKIVKSMFYSKESYRKMKDLLQKEKPDIIHIGLIHKQITYSVLKAIKEYNIPVVQSVHDLIFVCPCYTMFVNGQNCDLCMRKGTFNCIKNRCVKGSVFKSFLSVIENRYIAHKKYYYQIDAFITESNFYKKILKEAHITNSRIINLYNFLPPSKRISRIISNGEYFLYFGRFSSEKGILTLLKAYKEANPKEKLVLVGGGPYEDEVKKFVKENFLLDRIEFAGYVFGDKLEDIIENSKAVVVPSEWYENCPYSVLEAMAKSRIVIASRIAGLIELVEDGDSGYLFEPKNHKDLANKLLQVSNLDEEVYKKMCLSTYERATRMFDSEMYYLSIIQLYEELLKK